MNNLDVFGAYIRFVLTLGAGLFAFSLFVSGLIDQFFTEYSPKDYRRAHLAQAHGDGEALDVEDVSLLDLASQLTGGRSKRREEEQKQDAAKRSFRSLLSA